jgi:hypothetical protein
MGLSYWFLVLLAKVFQFEWPIRLLREKPRDGIGLDYRR